MNGIDKNENYFYIINHIESSREINMGIPPVFKFREKKGC